MTKINVHGLELEVVSEEELAAQADLIVVVIRVADAPHDNGVVRHVEKCNDCGEPVWVADSTPKNGTRVCLDCFPARVQGGTA